VLDDGGAGLGRDPARRRGRVPIDGEIDVDRPLAAQQVAHRAPDEVQRRQFAEQWGDRLDRGQRACPRDQLLGLDRHAVKSDAAPRRRRRDSATRR
jgi:hypothetical protein